MLKLQCSLVTAVQFGTAASWWQRCHAGKISIATRTENLMIARIVKLSKQVAELWQRGTAWSLLRFRLASSIIHKIIKLHFWATLWGVRGNISALSKSFNAKKLVAEFHWENVSFTRKTVSKRFWATLWGGGVTYVIHL